MLSPVVAFLLLALGLAESPSSVAPAAAAAAAAGQKAKAAGWQVDWGQDYCTLVRQFQPTGVVFALRVLPAGADTEAVFVGPPSIIPNLSHGGKGAMIVEPSGDRIEGPVMNTDSDGKRTLRLVDLVSDVPAAMAGASALRVERGAQQLSIPVARPVRALAALQQCIDSRMREWGIDPVAFAALRKAPAEGKHWLTDSDYPGEAINDDAQGAVIARFTTDAKGKVTDCAVVVSSRSKALDDATCRAALKRGRYSPAIGADGKPTEAKFITHTKWMLM